LSIGKPDLSPSKTAMVDYERICSKVRNQFRELERQRPEKHRRPLSSSAEVRGKKKTKKVSVQESKEAKNNTPEGS